MTTITAVGNTDPLARIAEFFEPSDEPYQSPKYSLEESPVVPLIGSVQTGETTWYFCKLHPAFKNIHWHTIEHTIKFENDHQLDHMEFLAKYYQDNSTDTSQS